LLAESVRIARRLDMSDVLDDSDTLVGHDGGARGGLSRR
jgi:hypothetical protein